MLLNSITSYAPVVNSQDGSSSNNKLSINSRSIYERRQSVAAPMLVSFHNKPGGISMHSRILEGTDNSQRYRRGSTAYSQFSLLSELDSEK